MPLATKGPWRCHKGEETKTEKRKPQVSSVPSGSEESHFSPHAQQVGEVRKIDEGDEPESCWAVKGLGSAATGAAALNLPDASSVQHLVWR